MSIEYYTVEKKENDLIIHSAMETWKYTIIGNFIILYLCLFRKMRTLFNSEPGTVLLSNLGK